MLTTKRTGFFYAESNAIYSPELSSATSEAGKMYRK
jgi:hypothetical protein